MNLVDVVEKLHANPNAKNILAFRTGDTVEVAVRIKEGEKIQMGSVVLLIIGRNEGGEPLQIPNLYGLSIFDAKDSVLKIKSLSFISICPDCLNYDDSLKARVETQTPEYIDGVLSPFGTTVTVFASPNFE